MPQVHQRTHQRGILLVGQEGSVQLDGINGKFLEDRKRGIASAKVIHGSLDAKFPQTAQIADDQFLVQRGKGFGDLHDKKMLRGWHTA